jgi:hypothetical protein
MLVRNKKTYNVVEAAEKLLAKVTSQNVPVTKESISDVTPEEAEPRLIGRWVYEGDRLICRWE